MFLYDEQTERKILYKLHERQWNPYSSNQIHVVGRDRVIQQGPASRLQLHGSYTLWPRIANSCDPQEVMEALDRLIAKLGGQLPAILFQDQIYTLSGFTLHPAVVKLHAAGPHSSKPLTLTPARFLRTLDTLVRGAV